MGSLAERLHVPIVVGIDIAGVLTALALADEHPLVGAAVLLGTVVAMMYVHVLLKRYREPRAIAGTPPW